MKSTLAETESFKCPGLSLAEFDGLSLAGLLLRRGFNK